MVPRASYGCRIFVRFDLGSLLTCAVSLVTRSMRDFRLEIRKLLRHNTCNAAAFVALAIARDSMLHKCANPDCSTPFLCMTQGKLFVVETQVPRRMRSGANTHRQKPKRIVRQMEHYWLCDECSRYLTLVFDPGRGTRTMPLPATTIKKTVLSVTLPASRFATNATDY